MLRLLIALAVALAALCSIGCATASPRIDAALLERGEGTPALRVMTFNIKSGLGGLEKVAAVIRSARPDVVALQEVDDGTTRAGGVDQARALARMVGLPWVAHIPTTRLHGGNYGMALLSRHPIVSLERRNLPVDRGMEPRVVAHALLDVGGVEVSLYKAHLSPMPQRSRLRADQAALIARLIAGDPRPTILVGDMNDVATSPAVRLLSRNLKDAWLAAGVGDAGTYPLPLVGTFRYDYVLASEDFEVLRSFVLPGDASDHHPVVADLELPAPMLAEVEVDPAD